MLAVMRYAGVHAERLVHKLDTFSDLKACCANPAPRRRTELRVRFDRIFNRHTGFVTLDRLLERLHANKPALLMVLDRPELPLHTNGSENDIHCQVTKRKISGGTRGSWAGEYLHQTAHCLRRLSRQQAVSPRLLASALPPTPRQPTV